MWGQWKSFANGLKRLRQKKTTTRSAKIKEEIEINLNQESQKSQEEELTQKRLKGQKK